MAKFAEFRIGEVVRRIYLPRTRVKTLLGMHRACWRANILVIGVFSDVRRRIALWRTSVAERPKKCSTTTST